MSEEKQLATLVGLDLILSPEHYKEITKLQQENKQLQSILTELEEWINSYIPLLDAGDIVAESTKDTLKDVLDKIQELKEKYNGQ